MHTETIKYKGYTVKIAQDEGPENPFEAWDSEPPLLTYYNSRHEHAKMYQDAPDNIRAILHLLPAETWERGKRKAFLSEFIRPLYSWREIADTVKEYGCLFDAVNELLTSSAGDKPSGWQDACNWFDLAQSLLKWGNIPCLYEQSNGYSQGDSTLCLVVLTPDWFKKVGASEEHASEICMATIDLYSAWAWGDVYGVASIHAPGPDDEDGEATEGEEVEHGSCWGFYGSDHEKSGLMDHVRDSVDWHIEKQAKEVQDLELALCSME